MPALTDEERRLYEYLNSPESRQEHLFAGVDDVENNEGARRLLSQLVAADHTTAGGLKDYIQRGQKLLEESSEGVNPFEGCEVEIPQGEKLEAGTQKFSEMEQAGMDSLKGLCFCLVAGGLGERLGFPGIKVALPVETQTNMCYLEWFCRNILEMQRVARERSGDKTVTLPLAIMCSGDTYQGTIDLLKEHNNFGMAEGQITLMLQDKVPGFINSSGKIGVKKDDRWVAEMKPHGHGDVHTLLLKTGLAQKWVEEGRTNLVFFQDTNALAMRAMCALLGVSRTKGFDMNSLCVPRVPGEAAGALCNLSYPDGRKLTCNVEYNQLGPLLQNQGGDVAGPDGLSPYPGNINCIMFDLPAYYKTLEESKGVVPEFVNPKYQPGSRTDFKSATRLECMMQDYARLMHNCKARVVASTALENACSLQGSVGFTMMERWLCFSCVKNATADAVKKLQSGLPADSAFSGEVEFWDHNTKMLQTAAKANASPVNMEFLGLSQKVGPRVVLEPEVGCCLDEIKNIVHGPIALGNAECSLIVEGPCSIKRLQLTSGAVVVHPNAEVDCDTPVNNKGWKFQAVKEGDKVDDATAIRGFRVDKVEAKDF
ncbi:UDP-N-acetylglucosamine pyrophosphorylase [Perkinsus olseni]|uniref:UTP-monosaccharide-1-phosphate uridylyltransferase n=1 Tax=Perkinsus olseni TaxID=32597 RepID=A0A7J6NZR0_PEROL|nr:UDP-N-acetylglucosamine pyrophosphorylase [Perkinsus olseni]